MSTTTNFKRIALVAVAALGLGVLSSVPSQATINQDNLTLSSSTASQTTAETYTASSAVATLSFFGAKNDSISVTAALVSAPAANTSLPVLRLVETTSAWVDSATGVAASVVGTGVTANTAAKVSAASSAAASSAKFAVYLSSSGTTDAPLLAGTYVVKLTPAAGTGGALVAATAQNLTITVTTAASLSKNVSAANSLTQLVEAGSSYDPANLVTGVTDSSVVAVKTASVTPKAYIFAKGYNANGNALTATGESLTVTISGAGSVGTVASGGWSAGAAAGTLLGKSILLRQTDYVAIYADGNAGVGTITITGATSGVLIATKTITFSSDAATKYAASTIAATDSSVIAVAGTTKVSALAQDAQSYLVTGLTGGTDIYAFSSDTSVATVGTPSFGSSTVGYSTIVTGVKVGTAEIVFGNASTLAASTIKSAPVKVRVGSATPSSVTVTTDKATYAPGEKITVTVTILDSTGQAVVGNASYANIFSSTGIVPGLTLSGTNTLPTDGTVSSYSNTTNTKTYTIYAPVTGGKLDFTYTGGTALATANQVAKTVSVTVADSGSAALAAVTALATTVASLRTLIVTLTNLVLKIQKKVKA